MLTTATTCDVARRTEVSVGMGEIAVLTPPSVGKTVVGSCIGLALYDPDRNVGSFAHIVLAEKANRPGSPGKFADTAVPRMLELLAQRGGAQKRLLAKLAGGAQMFGGGGPIQIGEANHRAVRTQLERLGIPVVGEHVGGPKGRRITFDVSSGAFTVEIVGKDAIVL